MRLRYKVRSVEFEIREIMKFISGVRKIQTGITQVIKIRSKVSYLRYTIIKIREIRKFMLEVGNIQTRIIQVRRIMP